MHTGQVFKMNAMFVFRKVTPYFCDVPCLFILLQIASQLRQGAQSALIVKPQNVVALSGEAVSLSCASDAAEGVTWVAYSPGSSEREYIFTGRILSPSVSSYISIYQEEGGLCSLQINVTRKAAKRYICGERGTTTAASAELIVLERNPECFSKLTDSYVNITCSVQFAGNWAPIMEWKTKKGQHLEVGLFSSNNDLVMSNLFIPLNLSKIDTAYKISVITKFSESGRPKETSATNVPEYIHTISPYDSGFECSEVSNSGHPGKYHVNQGVIVMNVVAARLLIGNSWIKFLLN